MIKVNCESCAAPYDVDPRRIPASGLKMRCPKCGATFLVTAQGNAARDGGLDLDLPALKSPPGKGAPALSRPQDEIDLPALKGRGSLPDNLVDDLVDPSGPGAVLKQAPSRALGSDFGADLDLDLPAPKLSASPGFKPAAQQARAAPAPAPAQASSAASSPKSPFDDLDLDLPRAKASAPTGFKPSKPATPSAKEAPAKVPELELDLPAAKGGTANTSLPNATKRPALSPAFDPQATPANDAFGSLDLDLPAPKAAQPTAKNQPLAPAFDAPAKPQPLAPAFDLDLPAPKPASSKQPLTPAFNAPAAKPQPLAPSFDLDLPAPKAQPPAKAQPLAPSFDAPAKSQPLAPSFDLDLPGVKSGAEAKPAASSKSFSKPQRSEAPASSLGGLPKDSLAIDPSPMFAGSRATGALGDLDEVNVAFTGDPGVVDLPAPSDLPQVKRAGGATMLGLGKMAKDSLDLPRNFEPAASMPAVELRGALPQSGSAQPFGGGFGDLDLPAPADLPRAKQPAKGSAEPLGEVDLPAPGDLPVRKKTGPGGGTMLGLGNVSKEALASAKEQAKKHTLDSPSPDAKPAAKKNHIADLLDDSLGSSGKDESPFGGGFDLELDLPPPKGATGADASGPIMLEKLSLPSAEAGRGKATFGATIALGADDLEMGSGTGGRGLSVPGLRDGDPFGGLNRGPANNQTMELDSMLELGDEGRSLPAGRGNNNFGELELGFDSEGPKTGGLPLVAPRALPSVRPVPQNDRAVDAELVGDEAQVGVEARLRKKRKARHEGKKLPGYVWPLLLVTTISAAGVGLGMFTHHGYFGVYLVEQLLPAGGDPAQVAAAIAQAEKIAKSDTYLDVRKSLTVLSDARNEAGLNHKLLARSLLNEALYQLRFGEDAQSAQRSVAILARVMERGPDAEGLTLARAADAARRGDLSQAQQLLAQAPKDRDPYRALVAGELALLQKQPAGAEAAFREAETLGASARGSWGVARALIAQGKEAEAEAAAKQTLSDSPLHAAALSYMARRAYARGDVQTAFDFVHRATGATKVGEQRARPSRRDRAEAWALAGQIEQQLDHAREAEAAYANSLAADPLRIESLIGSGSMLMRIGRARDALSRFDSALSARPKNEANSLGLNPLLEASLGAVQALLVLERPQEALPRATQLASQFPGEARVQLWLGHTHEALDKSDEAEAAFRKSIQLADTSFAGYVALSQLLFKKGRPEEGARILSQASGKVKDSAEVRRMLGFSELTRNHLPEAVHHFEASLRYDANDAGALLGLTTAQRKMGDIPAAEKTLAKLEKVDPTFAGLTLERGQLLESRGDYAAAADAYRKALEGRPQDTDLKLRLGAALVTAGRLDDAEAILPEVLKERPTSAEAEHFVGRLLFAKKETAQAVQHFERAIAFDALRPEYYLYLAWAYLDQGNLGGALSTVNKALERDPNQGDARWILGRIQLRTGAVKDAVASFQQALKLKPGRIEAYASMGDAYDQLRDLNAAIRSYQEAVQKAPENGDWWYRLGMLHLDKGSRDEARVALAEAVLRGDRLIEKPTWLADAHRVYGDVLREGGRTGEALEHYRVFLDLAAASHPDRAEIERIIRSGER